jgi:hypothetical protein
MHVGSQAFKTCARSMSSLWLIAVGWPCGWLWTVLDPYLTWVSILCMWMRLWRAYCLMRYNSPFLVTLAWDFPGRRQHEFIPRLGPRFGRERIVVAIKAVAPRMRHLRILRCWAKTKRFLRAVKNDKWLWTLQKTVRPEESDSCESSCKPHSVTKRAAACLCDSFSSHAC